MKSRGTWLTGILIALSLTVFGLLGCSFVGEPNSAEDLLVRYAANPNNTNFAADVNVNLNLALSGYRTSIPVTANLRAADSSAKGTVNADLTSIGDKLREYDVYGLVKEKAIVVYVKRTDEQNTRWDRTEIAMSFSIDIPLVVEMLSDAKFMRVAYESDDQICYELVLPAEKLMESLLAKGSITTSFGDVDSDYMATILKESKLHVCFNKDCLVRSVMLDLDFTYEDKEKIPVPVNVTMNASMLLDEYGAIDSKEVAVPGTVQELSKLTDDPFYINETSAELMEAAS